MVLLWESVLELEDCFESAIRIVPVKVEANISVAFPVLHHGVVVLECI